MCSVKTCRTCEEEKEVTEFSKDKKAKDGLQSSCKLCVRAYYLANRDTIAAYKSQLYKDNKEYLLAYARNYYQDNKEAIAVRSTEHYQDNKEYLTAYAVEYREQHREDLSIKQSTYNRTPKGKLVSKNARHKRRALIKLGSVTTIELQQLVSNSPNCHYCDCEITEGNWHLDHYIPLSKGGLHEIGNLVIACAPCNLRKGATMPEVFIVKQREMNE